MIRTAERRLEYTRATRWGPILRTRAVTFVDSDSTTSGSARPDAEARRLCRIRLWSVPRLKDELDRVAALIACLDRHRTEHG